MSARDRNTLKGWFETNDYPNQNQFWDWLDSFWNKFETISMSAIEGLTSALGLKADQEYVDNALAQKADQTDLETNQQAITTLQGDSHTHDNKVEVLDSLSKQGGLLYLDGEPVGMSGVAATMFLHEENSDITNYEKLLTIPANSPEESDSVQVSQADGEVLIDQYVTEPGFPGVTLLQGGVWNFITFLSVDSNVGVTQGRIRVFIREQDGTETEIFNIITKEINLTTPEECVNTYVTGDIILNETDRLVIKYFALTTSANLRTVTLYYEGTTNYSRLQVPFSIADFHSNQATLDKFIDSNGDIRANDNFEVQGQANSNGINYAFNALPTFNANSGNVQEMPVTGNCTCSISNLKNGSTMIIVLIQDATGGHTITLGASFGTKANQSADLSAVAGDENHITVWKTNGKTRYTITTVTP
jgi:hypothetical protein